MWNQILEDAILGKVISCLLDHGFRVVVSDQDGGGLHVYGMADNGFMGAADKADCFVKCVPGNGADFISDYSTSLEKVIKPANDFCKMVQE